MLTYMVIMGLKACLKRNHVEIDDDYGLEGMP